MLIMGIDLTRYSVHIYTTPGTRWHDLKEQHHGKLATNLAVRIGAAAVAAGFGSASDRAGARRSAAGPRADHDAAAALRAARRGSRGGLCPGLLRLARRRLRDG